MSQFCAVVRVHREVQGRKQLEERSESEGEAQGSGKRREAERTKGSDAERKRSGKVKNGAREADERKRNERREASNGRPTLKIYRW